MTTNEKFKQWFREATAADEDCIKIPDEFLYEVRSLDGETHVALLPDVDTSDFHSENELTLPSKDRPNGWFLIHTTDGPTLTHLVTVPQIDMPVYANGHYLHRVQSQSVSAQLV